MPFPKTRAEMGPGLYYFQRTGTCQDCHKPIEWWLTSHVKLIPMDPMPEDSSPAVAHWATCTNAARFRGGRK